MSMVSHCIGTRFTQLIGGVMTSFHDWYANLPVASPQVFGDQTDVFECGDWWDATYLMRWGSNVPVTRTPDAHWMTEVRYRGTKVVTISPDCADHQVCRRVAAGSGRHGRRTGHGDGLSDVEGVLSRPQGTYRPGEQPGATYPWSWRRPNAGALRRRHHDPAYGQLGIAADRTS